MKRNIVIGLSAAVALAVAAVAVAAPGMRGHVREMLAEIDTDGNHAISTAEAQAFFADRAVEIDTNRDGTITPAEVKAFHEAERQRRQNERFAQLDANKDGRVSVEEFAAARVEQIMSRDADGDGEVEPGEAFRGRHGRHGG